jgi:acetyl esterase/lipase
MEKNNKKEDLKMKITNRIGIIVLATVFAFIQCVPCGFSANKQVVAAVKQNAIPTKKVPDPVPVAAAKAAVAKTAVAQAATSKISAGAPKTSASTTATKIGNATSTTTDFLSKTPALSVSAPAAASKTNANVSKAATMNTSVSSPTTGALAKADKAAAALEAKAAQQSMIAKADTTKVINQVKTAALSTSLIEKKELMAQAKNDAKTLTEFARLQVAPKTFRYGTNLNSVGSLSLPPGHSPSSDPAPVVVLIHGGGFTNPDKDRHDLESESKYFNQNGYAVFNIDYKLHDIPAALEDTRTAIRWVQAKAPTYNLDANNVSIVGTSAGATLGAMMATQYPDEVNCVVGFSAAVNAQASVSQSDWQEVATTYSGPYPLDIVSPQTAPTLIFTGGDYDYPGFGDPSVAFGQQLNQNGVDGGTIVLPPPTKPDGTTPPAPGSNSSYYYHGQHLMNNGAAMAQTVQFINDHQR